MSANKPAAIVLSMLIVAAGFVPATAASTVGQHGTYTGTHVSFDTSNDAMVDYAVGGESVMESVRVQSKSEARSGGGVDLGADLSAVTDFAAAGLSLDATTDTGARVTTDSSAELRAHDNSRGILVIDSGGADHYVLINVSAASRTDSGDDQRVVVTTDDGRTGTFIVVGDGEVAVNEDGNVSADLDGDSQLVFRSYAGERDGDDVEQEDMIADGRAAAEVYVTQSSEAGSDAAVDVVQYSEDTAVEVTNAGEGTVEMTAERSEERGKVIITSVSEAAFSGTEDLQVTVDGEAAARASSYSDLRGAIGGDTSKYLVRQQSTAEADTQVLVAVNHFSERQIAMSSAEETGSGDGESTPAGSDGDGGSDGDSSVTNLPGFGMGVALVALLAAALIAIRRR